MVLPPRILKLITNPGQFPAPDRIRRRKQGDMRKSRTSQLTFEYLEQRRVLAGNIQALVNDSILLVVGDGADNQIEITENAAGGIVLSGVDTTVNGSADPVVIGGGFSHITVAMNGGNDEVGVTGVNVRSNFSFFGGQGNDRLTTNGLSARHFHGEGNEGDDVFEVNFNIRKSAYLYLGAGNDIVSSDSLSAGRNFKIFGDAGNDVVSTDALSVRGKLEFSMDDGADNVLLSGNTSVRRFANINLGDGNDFLSVLPTRNSGAANFRQMFSVDGGTGNDNFAFDAGVSLRGGSNANGGDGTDAIQFGDSNSRGFRVGGVENLAVSNLNNLIDQVFTRLQDVGIGVPEPTIPLGAEASATDLNFNENAAAVSVDSGFSLTGNGTVTGATVAISDFAAGQDVLTFSNTGAITGNFDANTGVMTLSGNASVSAYQTAIRSIQYRNSSDNPVTDSREFTFTVTSEDETVNATRGLQVTSVNDAPEVLPNQANQTVLPDDLPVAIDNQLRVVDPDTTTLTGATITFVSGFVSGEDRLISQDSSGITSSFDAGTGTLTLTGDASVVDWQTVLQSVTYSNDGTNPTAGVRSIRITINDGTSTGSTDFQINLQEEATEPNNFEVSQNAANGTVVGMVETSTTFETPTIYQFNNTSVNPILLLNADDHISGDMTASVVLIEYLDYQCPACRAIHPTVGQLETDFEGDLLVVRRHFPLETPHPNAFAAALVAEAAARQGMFEEYSDLLFENQPEWSGVADPTELFLGYASSIGLDLDQLRTDIADPDTNSRIRRDQSEGASVGVMSTPTFILQNNPIDLPQSRESFAQSINNALDLVDDPFTINRQTGEIVLRDNTLLNAANTPVVNLSILVVDTSGNTETIDVTINVTDQ